MNFGEGINLRGDLDIYLGFPSGRKLFFSEKNLIVTAAKQIILSSIYSDTYVPDPISQLRVGTGGCIDPNGLYPKIEDPAQTGLITPLLAIDTVYTLSNNNTKVSFLADVDQTQGNGSLISEAGLFKVSGAMFNVKNHPGITKTSDFSIHYIWSIRIL